MARVLLSEELANNILQLLNTIPNSNEIAAELKNEIDHADNYMYIVWSIEDVIARHRENNDITYEDAEKGIYPEGFTDVTEEQAQEIISQMEHDHDCEHGTTWSTIDYYLDELTNLKQL